jgi:hypothetical protein
MAGLRELQSEFTAALFDPGHALPANVISHTTRQPLRRFNVYRNNIRLSLIDLLQSYFPVVARLVGESFFRAMAAAFIVSDPPRSPVLSRYGARFPAFVQKFPPASDLPYLSDVARLEWLQQRAYHARDCIPRTAEDLAAIPAGRLPDVIFELHPAVGLLVSRFPVVSIWRTNTLDAEVKTISLDQGGETGLVVRPDLVVQVVPLPAGADTFVALLIMAHTVREAAAASVLACPDFDLQRSLALLIESGAIADFEWRKRHSDNPKESGNHECVGPQLH